jgi:uncharacterized protein YprB with RNaseH-like and TPR domain
MPEKSTLADKLKSLGVHPASDIKPAITKRVVGDSIHNVIEGRFVQTRRGETFVSEQVYSSDFQYGAVPIEVKQPLTTLSTWAREPRFLDLPIESYAFLDTETSGLAGGTGTYAFLVGAARFVAGDFHLAQFFMRDPSEEPALLEGLADFLAPCSALVTFNGKAFDAPLLVTRYTLHNIPVPFSDYAHLDLLPLVRRLWRDRLPSRALKYLEENILMAPRTSEEVPGYEIPYLYFDYLRSGDATPLKGVFYHNAMDVIAMSALLNHTTTILNDPFSELVEHGLDTVALAKLFEDIGQWDTAARLFERGLEMSLPEADFWEAVKRLSGLQKRRGDMETALRLWGKAADEGHVYAHVELAKYYEHNRRDYSAALAWTESAMQLITEQDLPRYVYNHWMDELNHRHKRLLRKRHSAGVGDN